jgi:O-succinylbenzoic acid--CoA ligase
MEQTSQRELRLIDPTWTLAELMAHITEAITSDGAALSFGPSQFKTVGPEIAIVIQTSGSTGVSKEVALSATALLASAQASNKFVGATKGKRWSLLLPLTHIAGINILMRSIELGTEPIDLRNSNGHYPDADFTAIVPTQLFRAINGDEKLLSHLKSAQAVLVGGGKLSGQLRSDAEELGISLIETYGMTETTGGCIYNGAPLENISYELGIDNRIKISGNTVASGYLGQDELWRECFDGKWFTTSDIGSLSEGKLQVIERTDDIVVSGGENVSLAAIESEIKSANKQIEVAAFAMQDLEWGNAIHLAVVGQNISEEEVRNLLNTRLGSAAKPKEFHYIDRIPLTALGKVDRQALIEMASKQ